MARSSARSLPFNGMPSSPGLGREDLSEPRHLEVTLEAHCDELRGKLRRCFISRERTSSKNAFENDNCRFDLALRRLFAERDANGALRPLVAEHGGDDPRRLRCPRRARASR